MKNNVINIKRKLVIDELPNDLITISKFAAKYGTGKSYIYKLIYKRLVKPYKYGYLKLSESEVLKILNKENSKWQA